MATKVGQKKITINQLYKTLHDAAVLLAIAKREKGLDHKFETLHESITNRLASLQDGLVSIKTEMLTKIRQQQVEKKQVSHKRSQIKETSSRISKHN